MKRFLALFLVCAVMLACTACAEKYEDTNGPEDYSLQTITDEDIIHLRTGASGLSYQESNLGLLKSSEYSSKNFNGVEQIYLTNFIGKSDVIVYIGHMDISQGNFRLVVINNEEIIHEFAPDTFNEEFRFADLTGTFSIHVAGESAAFTIAMTEMHYDLFEHD